MKSMTVNDLHLNDRWVIWVPMYEGKKQVAAIPLNEFDTIIGFWTVMNVIREHRIGRYMLMRKGVTPMWEDPHHSNGSMLTISVGSARHSVRETFIEFSLSMIGENLMLFPTTITGITFIRDRINQMRLWLSVSPSGELPLINNKTMSSHPSPHQTPSSTATDYNCFIMSIIDQVNIDKKVKSIIVSSPHRGFKQYISSFQELTK
jgi:hypothetical protein